MSRWRESRRAEILFIAVLLIGCAWRGMWLAAGVRDTTAIADAVRSHLQTLVADETGDVSTLAYFDTTGAFNRSNWRLVSRQKFDPDAKVWIVPGTDGEPGWAGWDDNQNGVVDDRGELGAAWSDDHCVTPADQLYMPLYRSRSRVINRGAYVPIDSSIKITKGEKARFLFTNQAAAD